MGARRNRSNEKSFQKFTWHASAAALCRAFAWLSGRFHIGVPYEFLDMSRLYVRVMTGFYSHRKTAKLRSLFGNDAFWIPPRLWAYAAEHQPDGNLTDYTSEVLADVLGCSKYANSMLEALKKCGFVDESGMIHDWNQHNGYHEKFAERAKKAAAARWSKEKSPTPPKEDIGKGKEERGDKHCLTDACSIKSPSAPVDVSAEDIYRAYPLKVAKPAALRAITKAMEKIEPKTLLELTKAYAARRNGDLSFMPMPSTWFNQERFNDDPSTWERSAITNGKPKLVPDHENGF